MVRDLFKKNGRTACLQSYGHIQLRLTETKTIQYIKRV